MTDTTQTPTTQAKKWYQSKTKWGALFVALAMFFSSMNNFFIGVIDPNTFLVQLLGEIGAVLAVFGVRDLPIINSFIGSK